MPDVGVDLKGAWPSIAQIIQRRGELGGHDTQHGDQGQGGQHADTQKEQGVQARTWVHRLLGPWRVRERGGHRGGTAHLGCCSVPTPRLGSIESVLLHSVIIGLWLAHPRGPLHREHWSIGSGGILILGDGISSGGTIP